MTQILQKQKYPLAKILVIFQWKMFANFTISFIVECVDPRIERFPNYMVNFMLTFDILVSLFNN